MKALLIVAISIYQRTLSPDHGWMYRATQRPYCKFQPTCSEYTRQAIDRYGAWRGSLMGGWRILRCNPWSTGGYDPIDRIHNSHHD